METTVEQKLKALYSLQRVDTKIDDIRRMRGELPMEVKDLEDEIIGLETRFRKLEDELNGYEDGVAQRKAGIKEANTLRGRYQSQLDNIKNSREFDALSKEIELQDLNSQLFEKEIRNLMAYIDTKKIDIDALQETLENRKKDLTSKRAELDTIIAETERDEAELKAEHDEARASIDERLLAAYVRIRSNARNGLGVVKITRDACGGCFNKIPPQRQMDIKTRKKVIVCEHCGRILVDAEMQHEYDGEQVAA